MPAIIAEVQEFDPRLEAASLLDFQVREYDPVTRAMFPAMNPHQTYIHHPESSFPTAFTQAAQYGYYPQTDMSATFPHDRTEHNSGTTSPGISHQKFSEDNDGLGEAGEHDPFSLLDRVRTLIGICRYLANGNKLPTTTQPLSQYNGEHAGNITKENGKLKNPFETDQDLTLRSFRPRWFRLWSVVGDILSKN